MNFQNADFFVKIINFRNAEICYKLSIFKTVKFKKN